MVCKSNLEQLGAVWSAYVTEHDGEYSTWLRRWYIPLLTSDAGQNAYELLQFPMMYNYLWNFLVLDVDITSAADILRTKASGFAARRGPQPSTPNR